MIYTRFGLRVREYAWLAHRLELIASITAPSLIAQQDQSFHWVILIDEALPIDIRRELEDVLEPFGERASLHQRTLPTPKHLIEIAKDCGVSGESPYLLTGRIDDDDAWSTTMVGAVRGRVASWLERPERARGLSLTFQDGLEWIMYEMLDVDKLLTHGKRVVHDPAIRRYQVPFIGMSVFVCSLLSDGTTAMGAHSRVAERLRTTKGFATDIASTDSPMWLCCRHKQAGSAIRKARGAEIHLTLADLAARFGIDEARVKNYLDHADEHEYAVVKRPTARKGAIMAELFQVNQELEDPAIAAVRLSQLHRKRDELIAEMDQLEGNLLGDPEALPTAGEIEGQGR